jgi:hypothetical protein
VREKTAEVSVDVVAPDSCGTSNDHKLNNLLILQTRVVARLMARSYVFRWFPGLPSPNIWQIDLNARQ